MMMLSISLSVERSALQWSLSGYDWINQKCFHEQVGEDVMILQRER